MKSIFEGNKELFILNSLEDKLVTALKKKDSRVLCEKLFKKIIICKEVQDKFSSFDHVHLKEELKVRYLVQHIYDAVKENKLVYHSFVDVLTEVDEGVVSELNKELHQHKLLEVLEDSQVGTSEALVGSKRPRTNIGEVGLCEADVPLLTELLSDGADKAEELGIALGLKEVEIKGCNNYKMGLCHVIQEWISSMESCTVNYLIAALKCAGLHNISFALESKNDDSKKQHLEYGTLQPKYRSGDITIARGKSALLGFQMTSLYPVQYEWRKNGHLLSDSSIYLGTTKSFLCINCADYSVQGQYECIVTDGQQQHTEQMRLSLYQTDSEFRMYFSNVYKVKKEVPESSWLPSSDKVINLTIISKRKTGRDEFPYAVQGDMDDILKGKQKLEYEQVFDQYESGSLLLVEGRPGSGKTTLMHKVSKDWALDKLILQGAEIVVLVPIRLLDSANRSIDLTDLFKNYIYNDKERVRVLEHFEKLSGEGVCFIIDGLNEYEHVKSYNSIILNLITKKVWPLAMIIVASRPIGTASLRRKCPEKTKRIEVLGFKADQISKYVLSYFQGNYGIAENLMLYLKTHINVYRMCYLPVHVAMICFLYYEQGDQLPQTESKIYEAFAMFSIVRKHKPGPHTLSLKSLTDNEKIYFSNICKLAFDMIVQSKQVILQSQTNFPLTPIGSDKSSLGLVTIDSTAELFCTKDLYAFLHLTFQEYLAAFYLSQLDSESEVIRKTKELKVNLRMVWKFYSGIVQFHKDSLILKSLMSDSKTDMLYKVQCAFESQQQIACDMLLELSKVPNSLCFTKNHFTPTDFLAISYVIETSHNQVTKLFFRKCSLDSEGVDLFLDKVSTGKLENIRYIGFNKKNCTVSEFKVFFKILCKIQCCIETLDIQSVDVIRPGIVKLLCDLKSSTLKYVYYDTNSKRYLKCISEICCGAVHYNYSFEMLSYCGNPISLMPKTNTELFQRCRKLTLINCGITDEAFSELMKIFNYFANVETIHLDFNKLTFNMLSPGIKILFINICHFSAQCNSIQDSGAMALVKVLVASTAIETLELQGNPITAECVEGIEKTFENHKKVIKLKVGQHNIEDLYAVKFISEKMRPIEAAFKHLKNVQELDLTEFIHPGEERGLQYLKYCDKVEKVKFRKYLNLPGVFALAKGLKSITNLQTLDFYFNYIGPDGAVMLAEGLKSCTNLQTLNLVSNSIGSDGAVAVAEGLKSFANLQTLDLHSNNIGSDGAVALAEGLKCCTNLQTLNLDFNNVSSVGAVALGKSLEQCTNLQIVHLAFNSIEADGAVALAEGIKCCINLQTFDLGFNNIGSNGAVALAESLKDCTNLQVLDLSSNKIGTAGAVALAQGLMCCTNLQRLVLFSNTIGSSGVCALEGLKSSINLQTLDLSSINIGSEEAVAQVEIEKSCTNLKTVNLSSNTIGSHGTAALEDFRSSRNLQILFNQDLNVTRSESDISSKNSFENQEMMEIQETSGCESDSLLLGSGQALTDRVPDRSSHKGNELSKGYR